MFVTLSIKKGTLSFETSKRKVFVCLLHLVSRVKFTDEPDVVAARVRMPSGRGTTASPEKQGVNIDKKKIADLK